MGSPLVGWFQCARCGGGGEFLRCRRPPRRTRGGNSLYPSARSWPERRGDGVHHLVGELPPRPAGGQVAVGVRTDRLAEAHRHRHPGPREPAADGLHQVGAAQADGHDGHPGGERQPRHPRAPLVEAAVARARALGVDAERDDRRGAPRERRRGTPAPRARSAGRRGWRRCSRRSPGAGTPHPGAGEVVGLGEEADRARSDDRDREGVDERQVVAGEDDPAGERARSRCR